MSASSPTNGVTTGVESNESAGAQHAEHAEEAEQIRVRREKLGRMRTAGWSFPNDFRRDADLGRLVEEFGDLDGEQVEARSAAYAVAGRILAIRSFGKSVFIALRDATGSLQLYAQKQALSDEDLTALKGLDVGDIVGARGGLFRTRTGELTLRCEAIACLVKVLRPLPEKWHGLSDVEIRYRRRYVDLIVNQDTRTIFERRARIVGRVRSFLEERGYIEVETPMMQQVAGGAAARPFVTHHNALSQDMYLRIAPELYLKRLVVGGFERVFELNRCFRNEGLSTEHNPEFTMCELYQAFADYEDLMAMTEVLFADLADMIHGSSRVRFGEHELNFAAPFARMTMAEAVAENSPLSAEEAENAESLERYADELGLDPSKRKKGLGLLADVFDAVAEHRLVQPTFITSFPVEISPLARASDDKPGFVDRFELFVAGREIANGFSELNDPEDQHARFLAQLEQREAGDDEAHMMDEDYVRALEYGLPPTAGEGIGIDRLVMLLTGATSIREVILFPHLKPQRQARA
ncbi:MAG: lysine--tRNA ligase [Myxococcales bacterium]|jgi:lysyl-tRNA synthetase class 2|nr:MAG: lysine--tRNA ligase [Myxococcales bacterium]